MDLGQQKLGVVGATVIGAVMLLEDRDYCQTASTHKTRLQDFNQMIFPLSVVLIIRRHLIFVKKTFPFDVLV